MTSEYLLWSQHPKNPSVSDASHISSTRYLNNSKCLRLSPRLRRTRQTCEPRCKGWLIRARMGQRLLLAAIQALLIACDTQPANRNGRHQSLFNGNDRSTYKTNIGRSCDLVSVILMHTKTASRRTNPKKTFMRIHEVRCRESWSRASIVNVVRKPARFSFWLCEC